MTRIQLSRGSHWPNSRLLIALIGAILAILELGFDLTAGLSIEQRLLFLPLILISSGQLIYWIVRQIRYYRNETRLSDYAITLLSIMASAYLLLTYYYPGWHTFSEEIYLLYFLSFTVIEYTRYGKLPARMFDHPQMLFATSFLVLIFIGTMLLKIPAATHGAISWVDALFTSTSSVCVTGLVVVDTSTQFTDLGQSIIATLIQIGGLGVMIFTSFFAWFMRGTSPLRTQLTVKELLQLRFVNARKFVLSVVFVTLAVELVGATLMYTALSPNDFAGQPLEKIGFCAFHAISSFCNAGFTTINQGFSNEMIKFNYGFQWVAMALIVLGGIGFFIMFNSFQYTGFKIRELWRNIFRDNKKWSSPWLLNLNTRLVILTSAGLIVTGWLAFLVLEDQHTLLGHSTLWGKITVAMFGAVTPRTAGFNVVDMGTLATPTLLIYLVLMWIGASPGSTGGGIKTTTFSVAILNLLASVRGKRKVEVSSRTVSSHSLHLAFATIFLSLCYLGIVVFLLINLQPELDLLPVVFESVSALGTVGLSLGTTTDLHPVGKLIITFTMFFGRVGLFTVLMSLTRQVSTVRYRYPDEEIIIT